MHLLQETTLIDVVWPSEGTHLVHAVMNPPSLFVLVVYISGYLFLLFAAVCLACGLYYLVELAEEYTIFTKKLIRVTILAQFPLHFFLWTYERFPFSQCAVGFASHLVYLMLLRSFPFIEPASTAFIMSCLMFALSNYSWFRFFHSDAELFYRYRVAPAPAMASFFLLIVWLVPCAFFCSLTVNDSVLPSAAGPPQAGHTYGRGTMEGGEKKKRSRNIVMAAFDSVVFTARNALGMPRRDSGDVFSAHHSSFH